MHRTRAAVVATACLLVLPSVARADLVRLIGGEWVEGKAQQGRDGSVKIKGYKGKAYTYPASEVKVIEPAELSWDVYAKRLRAISPTATDDEWVEEHLKLTRYLQERMQYCADLKELVDKEYDTILRKAPECEEARVGLGHVKWAGKWFKSPADRDKYRKSAPAAEMEALGFVKYKKTGLWEVKEDVEAMEAGKEKYQGKWMTPDDVKIAKGYVKNEKGEWVYAKDLRAQQRGKDVDEKLGEKPETTQVSDHFLFVSWHDASETAQLKDLAERAYAWWLKDVLGETPDDGKPRAVFDGEIEVFAVVDPKRKEKWLDTFGRDFGYGDEVVDHRKKHGAGWHGVVPPHFFISGKETEKNRPRNPEEDYENTAGSVASMVGRILLDASRGVQSPPWLHEANAFLTEIEFHESADHAYVSKTQYREQVADKQGSKTKYLDFVKTQVQQRLDRPFRVIFTMDLNRLDWADSMKAWSLLKFLLAEHRAKFREMLVTPMLQPEFITPAQIEAALVGAKPKDPAELKDFKAKDEGAVPTANLILMGPGAITVLPDSKEDRARRGAYSEAWLEAGIGKPITDIENDWKTWILNQ